MEGGNTPNSGVFWLRTHQKLPSREPEASNHGGLEDYGSCEKGKGCQLGREMLMSGPTVTIHGLAARVHPIFRLHGPKYHC